jgi:hypothetical protein
MAAVLEHLDQVSIFGRSSLALVLILGMNWAFSALHIYQEWRGEEVPLWRVFGAVVGVRLPDWVGFASFTLVLLVLLWATGLAGIAGWLPSVGQLSLPLAVGGLAAIVGARLSDSIVSHWSLYGLGYRPNPGLKSTPLYVIEACFILATFWKGLSAEPTAAWIGFALGAGLFILVLPVLRLFRGIPSWRHEAWVRGQAIPAWAKG